MISVTPLTEFILSQVKESISGLRTLLLYVSIVLMPFYKDKTSVNIIAFLHNVFCFENGLPTTSEIVKARRVMGLLTLLQQVFIPLR